MSEHTSPQQNQIMPQMFAPFLCTAEISPLLPSTKHRPRSHDRSLPTRPRSHPKRSARRPFLVHGLRCHLHLRRHRQLPIPHSRPNPDGSQRPTPSSPKIKDLDLALVTVVRFRCNVCHHTNDRRDWVSNCHRCTGADSCMADPSTWIVLRGRIGCLGWACGVTVYNGICRWWR